jgi:hypothetical protein
MRVPCRRPADRSRFDVSVSLHDERMNLVSNKAELRWDAVAADLPPLNVNWLTTCDPEFVVRHPIGPQGSTPTLRQRVQQGGSFAVLAPRRFGKTTLVKFSVAAQPRAFLYIACTLPEQAGWDSMTLARRPDRLQETIGCGFSHRGRCRVLMLLSVRRQAFARKNPSSSFDEAALLPKGSRGTGSATG